MELTTDYVIMASKLQKITPKWQQIIGVLTPTTFLAGGLVLQTILGEDWPTDIDIFTTDPNFTEIHDVTWESLSHSRGYEVVPGVLNLNTGRSNR